MKSSRICAVLGVTEKFTLRGPITPKLLCRGSMSIAVSSCVLTWKGGANCTTPWGLSLAVTKMSTSEALMSTLTKLVEVIRKEKRRATSGMESDRVCWLVCDMVCVRVCVCIDVCVWVCVCVCVCVSCVGGVVCVCVVCVL